MIQLDKETLSQYKDLKREIKLLEGKIKELEQREVQCSNDVVKGSSKHFPYTEHPIKLYGCDEEYENRIIRSIESKKMKLVKLKVECEEKENEIYDFIHEISDSKVRQIFMLKYIDNLSWLQIARKVGYREESSPRKIHDNLLYQSEKSDLDIVKL